MVRQINRLSVIKNIQRGIQAVIVLVILAILYINYESIIQLLKNI
jgi:hypothetical protein